ncbi:hypothetical protein BpHYR1_016886 [Brachionus plicatilis]|uniref:Uncharacterized protein n=1 Tax=Brachionus plicatilis TaxID=10195 RepID=A0A3M7RGW5_BRAPC|nr:hypothetical protein BpHYR1_016886 [Brachionus plicatilis]
MIIFILENFDMNKIVVFISLIHFVRLSASFGGRLNFTLVQIANSAHSNRTSELFFELAPRLHNPRRTQNGMLLYRLIDAIIRHERTARPLGHIFLHQSLAGPGHSAARLHMLNTRQLKHLQIADSRVHVTILLSILITIRIATPVTILLASFLRYSLVCLLGPLKYGCQLLCSILLARPANALSSSAKTIFLSCDVSLALKSIITSKKARLAGAWLAEDADSRAYPIASVCTATMASRDLTPASGPNDKHSFLASSFKPAHSPPPPPPLLFCPLATTSMCSRCSANAMVRPVSTLLMSRHAANKLLIISPYTVEYLV